jgi:hypothetical protein
MRGLALLLVAVCIFTPTLVAQSDDVTHNLPPLELTISTDHKIYTTVDEIPIHIQLKNTSEREVFVGRDLWSNASAGCVTVTIMDLSGRPQTGIMTAVDGLRPNASLVQLPKEVLRWGLLLPPGFSYGYDRKATDYVEWSDLLPGSYKVTAAYESRGVDADNYMNPFLAHPDVVATLQEQNWKGQIASNQLIVRIVSPRTTAHKSPKPH